MGWDRVVVGDQCPKMLLLGIRLNVQISPKVHVSSLHPIRGGGEVSKHFLIEIL